MKKKFNQLQKDMRAEGRHLRPATTSARCGTPSPSWRRMSRGCARSCATATTPSATRKAHLRLEEEDEELEKFKFVLDYKIKELKKEIEPREQDVADMKHTIQSMDHELEHTTSPTRTST